MPRLTIQRRLERRTVRITETGCLIWLGKLDKDGYGVMVIEGRQIPAHKASYEDSVGPVPSGLQLDHLCRVRCCVEPRHLEPVTCAENIRRGLTGKNMADRTHCPRNHPYDAANTYFNRKGARHCRLCKIERRRERRAELEAIGPVQGPQRKVGRRLGSKRLPVSQQTTALATGLEPKAAAPAHLFPAE